MSYAVVARDNFCMTKSMAKIGSGGPIRTDDLWVMSPTSYQAAPPRNVEIIILENTGFTSYFFLLGVSLRTISPFRTTPIFSRAFFSM